MPRLQAGFHGRHAAADVDPDRSRSGAGEFCDASGECAPTSTDDPPLLVPDGNGGQTELEDLPVPATTPVGPVPGDFSVSDQGTAQYNIPIQVPPGRAGLEPALSLRYIGSRSNGDTGVGWRLEGLSQITRCPKIHALDGYSAPIKNDPSDRFCIDGKRLESVAGVYGENGTEYRTLVDTFAKVVSYSDPDDGLQHPLFPGLTRKERGLQGPDYFRVWLKDGRILTYGRTRDALVTARNGVRSAWMLNRVEDRSGNTIIVGYTALTESRPFQLAAGVPNSVRPSVIAYTGNGNKAGDREVRFAYESRADDQLTFMQGGSAVMINERLKSITTYVKNAPVRTYRLEYREGHASLLERVYECAGDGTDPNGCKRPTTFDYVEESGFVQGIGDPTFLEGGQLDVNGDGVPDFLTTRARVNPVAADPVLTGVAIGLDVGIAVASYAAGPIGGIAINIGWAIVKGPLLGAVAEKPTVTFTSSLQFGNRSRIATPQIISNVSGLACKSAPSFFVDYDQDGRDDVASLCLLNGLRISRSTGDGHFAAFPTNSPVVNLDVPHSLPGLSTVPPAVLFDLNGDSLQDLVSCKDHYTLEARLRLAPPQGFADPIQVIGASIPGIPGARLRVPFCSEAVPTYRPFDVDGDGAPELIARHTPEAFGVQGDQGWYVLRFTRSSTGIASLAWERINLPDVASKIPGFGSSSSTGKNMLLADINGDGLADIWRGDSSDEATVWLNTGNNRFLTTNVAHPRLTYDFDPQFRLRTTALVDHDADGRLDILEHWENRTKTGFAASDNTVLKLGWNPVALTADYPVPDLYFTTPDASGFGPGDIKAAGDIDGDGNVDLFGPGQIFYGSGLKNMLLSKVTDGQGKVINVAYDGLLDTYRNECGSSSTWPEICLKQMKGLVSSHSEGFVFVDAQGISREQTDRTYSYSYTNARMNVTGHGWLGFDRRTATLTSSIGNEFHSVTTEFWPVQRFRPSATTPTTATNPPYLYPLVGLPRRVTTDQSVADAQVASSPLEDAIYSRRTVVGNHWEVQQSADHRPFPVLASSWTSTYSRRVPLPLEQGLPFEDNGTLRTDCYSSMRVDGYGNLTSQADYCQPVGDAPDLENGLTTTTFTPNRSAWLIGNAERVTKTHSKSFRTNGGFIEEHEQTQVFLTEYDAVGRVNGLTRDPDGQADKTTYFRDSLGNIERIVESSNGQAARTTTVTFDDDGVFPTKVTNAKGHTTEVHYDKRFGALHKLVDPNGVGVVHAYDALGLLHDISGPSGLTTLTYAQAPAPSGVETPAGTIFPVLEVSIERQGLDGTHGGASAQELDPYGRRVRTRSQGFDGAEVITEQAYDAKGRVAAATAPHLASSSTIPGVRYTHDYLDRTVLVEHTQTTGNSTTVTASRQHQFGSGVSLANGRTGLIAALDDCPLSDVYCGVDVELTIDEEGKQNAVVKDHRGNIIRSVDGQNIVSLDHASHYQYGAFNRLRSFRDNANAWHSLVHDPYGRLLIHADADTGATVSEYNGFSELTKTTDPKGQVRQYQYDVLGRLIRIDDPAGATRWVYDEGVSALGQLSQTISPATPQNPFGQQIRYTYEPATPDRHRALPRSIEHVIDGTSYVTELTYDDLSRLDTVAYPALGTDNPIVAKYDYDPASAALAAVREIGSGTSRPIWRVDAAHEGHLIAQETFGNGATTNITYDPDRRFLTALRTSLGTEPIQDLAYTHYANGQIHERITPAKTEELNYDPLGRLSSVFTSATGTATNYLYDHHGNLTRRGTTDLTYRPGYPHLVQQVGANTYNHDLNGNVTQRSGPDIPGGNQTFQYTPFDLPKIVTTGTGLTTRVAEFDYTADGTRAVRREVLGGDGARHFVGDLYQRLVSSGGTTLEQRYRLFAGSRTVAEIRRGPFGDETYYFHQDHQGSPETIMSADPIMQAPFWSQGLNRWAYVFNDPVNLTDPSGFMTGTTGGDIATVGVASAGYGGVGYGIATELAKLTFNAGAGLGAGVGLAANLGVTGVLNPFGGSAGGQTYNVAAPTTAPKTSATSRNSLDPWSQRTQPGPPAAPVERTFEAPQYSADTAGPVAIGKAIIDIARAIWMGIRMARNAPPPAVRPGAAPAPAAGMRQAVPPPPAARLIDPKTLMRPEGMGNAAFGNLIGWTRGGNLQQNLAQTQQLIKDLPGRIGPFETPESRSRWPNNGRISIEQKLRAWRQIPMRCPARNLCKPSLTCYEDFNEPTASHTCHQPGG